MGNETHVRVLGNQSEVVKTAAPSRAPCFPAEQASSADNDPCIQGTKCSLWPGRSAPTFMGVSGRAQHSTPRLSVRDQSPRLKQWGRVKPEAEGKAAGPTRHLGRPRRPGSASVGSEMKERRRTATSATSGPR